MNCFGGDTTDKTRTKRAPEREGQGNSSTWTVLLSAEAVDERFRRPGAFQCSVVNR